MTQTTQAEKALRGMGLAPLSLSEILRVHIEDAHAILLPYFARLPVNPATGERPKWFRTPDGMRDGLLGTNKKTELIAPIDCRVRALALAPASESEFRGPGVILGEKRPAEPLRFTTVCPFSNRFCRMACIAETGQYRFRYARAVRIAKTRALLAEPKAFCRMLIAALLAESHRAIGADLPLFFRLNTLSDIPWELFVPGLFDLFDRWPVTLYDYTKIPGRVTPPNYRLTFSRSGTNDRHVDAEIARGQNVAVVGHGPMPQTWRGIPCINGDEHDVRALDPQGVIVWLRYKLPATGATVETSGPFVVWS